MAQEKLFPKPLDDDRAPKKTFEDIASKVFSTPKSEIDERERAWKRAKDKRTSQRDRD